MTEITINPARSFSFTAPTNKEGKSMRFSFEHSDHSLIRSRQRSICNDKLSIALRYGQPLYKQGLVFYVLGEKDIPQHLARRKNELENTVVVVAGDTNRIITCYRNARPYHHIKTKTKRLYRSRTAA